MSELMFSDQRRTKQQVSIKLGGIKFHSLARLLTEFPELREGYAEFKDTTLSLKGGVVTVQRWGQPDIDILFKTRADDHAETHCISIGDTVENCARLLEQYG